MENENVQLVNEVIENYFQGIFNGDTHLLKSVFDSRALLFGDINGIPYCKDLNEYLQGVKERKSPKERGEKFRMKLLSLEVTNTVAIAKLNSPMFEFNYIDFLSIHKIDQKWVIVNKIFTHKVD